METKSRQLWSVSWACWGVVQRHTKAKNTHPTEDVTGCAPGTTEEHRVSCGLCPESAGEWFKDTHRPRTQTPPRMWLLVLLVLLRSTEARVMKSFRGSREDLSQPSQQAFRLTRQLQWAQMKEVWLYLGRSLAWGLPRSFLWHSSLFFTRGKKKAISGWRWTDL